MRQPTLWFVNRPRILHAILNVDEIPLTEKVIRYLHTSKGLPANETWIKSIQAGNVVSWPGLKVRAVRWHFTESDETQQGHTKKTRQGLQSTLVKDIVGGKNKIIDTDADESPKNQRYTC